jgi:hypothetical protein
MPQPGKPANDGERSPPLPLSQVREQRVSWLWPDRIPLGRLTVLDGDPGLGKSTVMLDLAARLTTGRPMPDGSSTSFGLPAHVLLLSAEDEIADTIRPRLEAAGANLDRVIALPYLPTREGEYPLRIPADTALIARMASSVRARLIVIDPLVAYLAPEVSLASNQAIRLALLPLALIAALQEVAVVLVRHLNKSNARNPLYRGGGSIGLIGSARAALLVAPDPDDPSGARRILATTKSNLGPSPPSLAYRLVEAPNGAATLLWEAASEHTAASLLAHSAQRQDGGALDEARSIVRAILADGPVAAHLVRKQARQAGLGPSILWRAKAALGVRSRKLGQPGQSEQGWTWELPNGPDRPLSS